MSMPALQAPAELGAGDVEHGLARLRPRRARTYCATVLDVDHLLERHHLDAELGLDLAQQLLGA